MLPFPEIEKIAEPPPPVVEPGTPWDWWVAVIALGLVLLGLFIWLGAALWRRWSLPGVPAGPEKLAMRELKLLRRKAAGMVPADFATALSGIVRELLQRRMGLLPNSTTPELLGRAHSPGAVPPPPLATVFAGVLETCDTMKFGGAAASDRAALLTEAETAVRSIKQTLSSPPVVVLLPSSSPPPTLAAPLPANLSPHEPAV